MSDQTTFGDFVLGLEGLAILFGRLAPCARRTSVAGRCRLRAERDDAGRSSSRGGHLQTLRI